MQNKMKNIVVTVTFVIFIAVFAVMCILRSADPVQISESENRPLAQFPTNVTWEGIADGSVIESFEDYTVDQFPFREFFRSVKAHFQLKALGMKENNGYAVADGYIAQIVPEFTPELIEYSVGRLAYVYENYLKENGGDVFVSIVPDKNYFFAKDYGYPAPDYEALVTMVKDGLPDANYVDIFDCLELQDYYRTDTHWRQEALDEVVEKLAGELGITNRLSGEYVAYQLEGFEGVYAAQSALYPAPETLTYLTNATLDACTVYDYETGKTYGIYNRELFESDDGYNLFLSGTRALLQIDNPNATTEEELVVFRDSFGSSLIPLFAEGYKSIYVVDIRYIMPDMLGSMLDFQDKNVLFLYSPLVLNQKAFR